MAHLSRTVFLANPYPLNAHSTARHAVSLMHDSNAITSKNVGPRSNDESTADSAAVRLSFLAITCPLTLGSEAKKHPPSITP